MTREERKLEKMLADMAVSPEERKRRAQAVKLRQGGERSARAAPLAPTVPLLDREDWEAYDELDLVVSERRRPRVDAGTQRPAEASTPAEVASRRRGVVLSVAQGLAHVAIAADEPTTAPQIVLCRVAGSVAARQQTELAVGDQVEVEERGGVAVLVEVLPRRSRLSRPDPYLETRERVIAANVDLVLIVEPVPLRVGLVDRLILAVGGGGALPLVVASKLDLAGEAERAALARETALYATIGVPVVPCSTATGEGLAELTAALGRAGELGLAVLVGQSGVGKSSLLNALDPALALATQEIRGRDGKGRHTTTAAQLHRLAGGLLVIDTPGIRQFGLWEVGLEGVLVWFPELASLVASCRFRDCRHDGDPGCGLTDPTALAAIAPDRLELFQRMVRAVGRE